METTTFQTRLNSFLTSAQDMIHNTMQKTYFYELSIKAGKKYVKILATVNHNGNKGQQSLFCFINMENGDILKAESYSKPHPTPRGNIFSEDLGMSGINTYGANYIR